MFNTRATNVQLYKNTKVGQLISVEPIDSKDTIAFITATQHQTSTFNNDRETHQFPEAFLRPSKTSIDDVLLQVKLENSLLSPEGQRQLKSIIVEHQKVFLPNAGDKLSFTPYLQHQFFLAEDKVIRVPGLRVPHAWREEVDEQVHELFSSGAVEPSLSPYLTPLVAVKKLNKKIRLVMDFRFLNSITVQRASATIPNITEIFDNLRDKTYFSVLDLRNAYHSVEIFEEHRQYTAFQNVDGQILQWRAMPFGLASAPATFSVLMAHVLQGTIGKFAQNCLDDILVYSDSKESHLLHIQLIIKLLSDAELKVSIEKCVWATSEVSFLGHVVSSKGLLPKPSTVDKIINLEPPKDLKGLRSLYGILSYYRKFQANFATIAEPLTRLMRKNSKFVWSAECQAAFEKLRDALVQPPILRYPLFTQKFTLACDASLVGAGAVLS